MKKILSIDWDFFVDATNDERLLLFPDGNENLSPKLCDYIWSRRYDDERLAEIGCTDDLTTFIEEVVPKLKDSFVYICDSHKHAYSFITGLSEEDEEVVVYNLDHHHDLYHYRTSDELVNCGNWGTILLEDRPNTEYIWVKRDDSDSIDIFGEEVPARMIDFDQFLKEFKEDPDSFKYVFVCKSSMWSPPHLDSKFTDFCTRLYKARLGVLIYENATACRNLGEVR